MARTWQITFPSGFPAPVDSNYQRREQEADGGWGILWRYLECAEESDGL